MRVCRWSIEENKQRIGSRTVQIDDRYVYIMGGNPAYMQYSQKVYLFDNQLETIEELSFTMPLALKSFAAVWVPNGRLYIAGGDIYPGVGVWSDKIFYSESLSFYPTMAPSQPSSSPSDAPANSPTDEPTPSPVYYIKSNLSSIFPNTKHFYGNGYLQFSEQLIECKVNNTQACLVECVGNTACLRSTINCGENYCGIQCVGDDGGTLMPCQRLNVIAKNTKILEILCKGKDSCDQMTVTASNGVSFSITTEGESASSFSQIDVTNVDNVNFFCHGERGCEKSQVTATGVIGFIAHSTGEGALEDSTLTITNSEDVTIVCNATDACKNLEVRMDETVSRGSVSCATPNACRYLNTFCPLERTYDGYTEVINLRCFVSMHANDRANYIYSPFGNDYVGLDCVEEESAWITYGGTPGSLEGDIAAYDDAQGLSCENTEILCEHLQETAEDYTCLMA